jgi:hypothetical protein
MTIAEPSADAFLFADDDRREVARVRVLRGKSKRARATSITSETKAPADAHWVDRRAMKRAR